MIGDMGPAFSPDGHSMLHPGDAAEWTTSSLRLPWRRRGSQDYIRRALHHLLARGRRMEIARGFRTNRLGSHVVAR
jgi:hypothetical protein